MEPSDRLLNGRGPLVTQSLQEAAYDRLREMLQDGEFRERTAERGIRLRELADLLGVSTMPVREAVRRLEAEGLLEFTRTDGIKVVHLSRTSFEEIAEMRVRLETLAMDRALPRIGEAELTRASRLVAEMDQAMTATRWRQANHEFHATLYAAGDFPRLLATVENLWAVLEPYLRIYTSNRDHLAGAQAEHRSLLGAVRQSKRQEALALVEAHIRRSETLLLESDAARVIGD